MSKFILLFSLLFSFLTTQLSAGFFDLVVDKAVEKGLDSFKSSNSNNPTMKNEKVNINSLLVKKYINDKNCDQILSNGGYFTTCYDNELKSALYGYSKLDGKLVNSENIKERPKFFTDQNLKKSGQTEDKDYTRSGFDRGHTIASDASMDFSHRSQLSTYAMSNITPQYPNTNRKSYLAIEKYERLIASKLGEVETMTFINFSNKPKRIGHNQLAIPDSYNKIYWNDKQNFQRCFHIPNDDKVYDLSNMEVSCKDVLK